MRKHFGKCPLGRPNIRWKDTIKIGFKEIYSQAV
jgi:hypothetical protein